MDPEVSGMLFNLRGTLLQLVTIFLQLLPPDLIHCIITAMNSHNSLWNHLDATKKCGKSVKSIYQMITIKIRIQGLQNRPLNGRNNSRPIRTAVLETRDYFVNKGYILQDRARIEKLLAVFLLTYEWFDALSRNFHSIVREIGEYVAGDEKLLKYHGDAGDIIACPSKPDKIGLWFYQMVGKLFNTKRSYMLDFMLYRKHSPREHIAMVDVDKRWGEIVL
jgi:hypothetical protein